MRHCGLGVVEKDGLVNRLNKDVFNRAVQSPLDEVYTNHAKALSKVPGEKVIHIAKWKVRKMRGNFVRKGVAVPGTYEDDGYDWGQASLRSMSSKIQVRSVPSRPGRFVRVKREPSRPNRQTDIRNHGTVDLTKSKSKSAFKRPAMMHADNDSSSFKRMSAVRRCGEECGKSLLPQDSFPTGHTMSPPLRIVTSALETWEKNMRPSRPSKAPQRNARGARSLSKKRSPRPLHLRPPRRYVVFALFKILLFIE